MSNNNLPKLAAALSLLALGVASATALAGDALNKIRDGGHLRLAYLPNARPFTSGGAGAAPEGYGIALCERIAASLKTQLAAPQLAVDWVPVTVDTASTALSGGQADLLCTPSNATLARRKTLAFSLPVYAGGLRAVVRDDLAPQVREAIELNPRQRRVWRGTPAQGMVEATRFAVVAGTSSENWLRNEVRKYKLNTATTSVPDYASGIKFLMEDKIDVFFGQADVALAAMDQAAMLKLRVLNRQITREPLALAMPRGDEDLRLAVDTALSTAYASADFATLYGKYFGSLDDDTRNFFAWVTPAP